MLLFASSMLTLLGAAAPIGDTCSSTTAAVQQAGQQDIVDTAVAAGSFETLARALKAAGLVDALKGKGPFTVFAPTDAAFAALPEGTLESLLEPENRDTLRAILTYHVVPGRVLAEDVAGLKSATTLEGQRVAVRATEDGVTIDGARVTGTDILCSNGVIHVIDAVILPSTDDVVATAVAAGHFRTLVAAVKAAGLVEALQGKGPFTVFAPTDDAFAALPAGTVESLLEPANRDALAALLKRHVIPGRVYSDALAGGAEPVSLQGAILHIRSQDGHVLVNGARVVQADVQASNGVIHVIDSVLLPE